MIETSVAHEVAVQVSAVRRLLDSLAADGIGDEESIELSIASETSLIEAIEAAVDRIAQLDAMAASLKAREDNFYIRRARFDAQRDRIKRSIVDAMAETGQRKLEVAGATIYTSEGRLKAILTDKDALPSEYLVPQPSAPDMAAITAALRAGAVVPGATLSNRSVILNIRTQ